MLSFKELPISAPLHRAIEELGFTNLTPIQEETLPVLLDRRTDFLGMAATGTGKTAAYAIPLLSELDVKSKKTQVLILSPTRELTQQIADSIQSIGKYMDARLVTIYGGAGYADQIRGLKQGAHIVIATPGRLIDHLERGTVDLSEVGTVILDEADKMISMGFKEDMEKILKAVKIGSKDSHTWLFSATLQPDLRRVAEQYLKNPVRVQINSTEMLSGTVEQLYYPVAEDDKPEAICRFLEVTDDFYGLIFCQTKALVTDLSRFLRQRGYAIEELHGDKSQFEREQTLKRFRAGDVKILVCTDVAARGLDVKDLTLVVNYSLPRELESYVHRIGRTGRSGAKGVALSLVTRSHFHLIRRLEELTGTKIKRGAIPTATEVARKKMSKLLERFSTVDTSDGLLDLFDDSWAGAFEGKDAREIAARFIGMAFPDFANLGDTEIGLSLEVPLGRRGDSHRREGGRSGPPSFSHRPKRPHPAESQRRSYSSSSGSGEGGGGNKLYRDRESRPYRGGGDSDSRPYRPSGHNKFTGNPGRSNSDRPASRGFGGQAAAAAAPKTWPKKHRKSPSK